MPSNSTDITITGNRIVLDSQTDMMIRSQTITKIIATEIELKDLNDDGFVVAGPSLRCQGNQVLTEQQAAVANATGAGDVVARLNELLAAMRNHGLIAT